MADSTGVSSEKSSKNSNIDVTKLTPLSPEVISKQATINIGTIGHVAHGKSTVVKALSGVQTVRFKNELERNITIKLDEEKGGEEVHSTMVGLDGDEEDEDLQVLAEIQSTVDLLKKQSAAKFNVKTIKEEHVHSPPRPSVIQHTEKDSPVKKNLSKDFEDMDEHIPSTPESVDSDKVKAVAKKKPGPKSKTQPIDNNGSFEVKRKPGPKSKTQLIVEGSDTEVKKRPGPKSKTQPIEDESDTEVKRKPGPKSKSLPIDDESDSEVKKKPGPKSKTQPMEDESDTEVKRKPGPKSKSLPIDDESDSEVKKKPGPKSKTQATIRDYLQVKTPEETKRKPGPKSKTQVKEPEDKVVNKESETKKVDSERKKIGPKSRTQPKPVIEESDSDSDFDTIKKKLSSTIAPESDDDNATQSKKKSEDAEEEKMEVDSEPEDTKNSKSDHDDEDNEKFRPPKTRGASHSEKLDKIRNLRTKSERKSYRHYSSDEDSKPVAKKQRTMSSDSTGINTSGEKKTKKSRVDMSYRIRRRSKKRRTSTYSDASGKSVTRDTPSETRKVEEGNPIDFTVGRQDDGEYEVETVLDSRISEGRQYYKIKWRGWPETFNTWEPMEFLVHSQEALLEFFQCEPKRCQERLGTLGEEITQLVPLTGRFAEYERDVVSDLKKDELESINVFREDYTAILPNYKLLCAHITKYLKNSDPELQKKIRTLIAVREKIRLRHEQLKLLKEWEVDMIEKSKHEALLTVENVIDLEGPPLNFHFRNANVPGEGVEIPDDPFVGCECDVCGDGSKCCSAQSGSKFAYTSEGLLKVEHGTPVYECNKRCKCSASCSNRIVQKGRTVKLNVFRTPNKIGWGVRVMEDVPQGKFVCEYIGEVVKKEIADERIKSEYKGRPLYIFDLDFNDAKEFPYTVDAYQYGNISHFINHSCEPNLAVYAVWIDCLDPNLPRLAMFAIRDIKKGEELTFDYSAQYHRKRKSHASKKEPSNRRSDKTPCQCGSALCRQVLF